MDRSSSTCVALACAAVCSALVAAPEAAAIRVPSDAAPTCSFVTSGPAQAATAGDWYTARTTASADRRHLFLIDVPPAAGFPITVRVLDAESVAGAADADAVTGLADPTRFVLRGPGGAVLATQTFPGGLLAADNQTFTATITIADGPGPYVLSSETGSDAAGGIAGNTNNDDRNAFIVEVTPDSTDATTLADDVVVSILQSTIECASARTNFRLSYLVPAGAATSTLRNFDLDAPAAVVTYLPPSGAPVVGTGSGDGVWNGGGDLNSGGDTVPLTAAQAGLWHVNVATFAARNQTTFEALVGGVRMPLIVGDGAVRVGGVTVAPSGTRDTQANVAVDHPFFVRNNGNFSDAFDLTTSGTGANFTVSLRTPAGVLLTDTNGDGKVDSGPVAPGQTRQLLLRITPNAGTATGTVDTTRVSGCSALQRTATPAQPLCDAIDLVTTVVTTAPPAAPTINTPTSGAVLTTQTPTVFGVSPQSPVPTTSVEIFVDGLLDKTVAKDSSNNFLATLDALPDGSYELTARAVTSDGRRSGFSATVVITIDTTAPDAPVLTQPANGSVSSNNRPTLIGTAEARSAINVVINGVSNATSAEATGGFAFRPAAVLADGSYTVTATATDAAGNTSLPSDPLTFRVDTVAPAPPAITAPAPNAALTTRTPTFSGTAEASSSVAVFVDGQVVATVAASASGAWSYALSGAQALGDGTHTAVASASDAAGNTSPPSASLSFVVDTGAPGVPLVLEPGSGSVSNRPLPAFRGSAEANATVTLVVDGAVYATLTASPAGAWSYAATAAAETLADGSHTVQARARDRAGNESALSFPVTFVVDTRAPAAPLILLPTENQSLADSRPRISGTAEPRSTVQIFIDAASAGSIVASASGEWALTPTALLDGAHVLTAEAQDLAGNTSARSADRRFRVDTRAPEAPVLTAPPVLTNDPSPTARGTTEPGTYVEVELDGLVVGTAFTAVIDGRWGMPLSTLAEGEHIVTATAIDGAGNRSLAAARRFVVDRTPPPPPRLTSPEDGRNYLALPLIVGSAVANVALRIAFDGAPLAELRSDAAGGFTLPFPASFRITRGDHLVSVVAVDEAGNVSGPGTARFFLAVAQSSAGPEPLVSGGQFTCASGGDEGATPAMLISFALLALAIALARRRARSAAKRPAPPPPRRACAHMRANPDVQEAASFRSRTEKTEDSTAARARLLEQEAKDDDDEGGAR